MGYVESVNISIHRNVKTLLKTKTAIGRGALHQVWFFEVGLF